MLHTPGFHQPLATPWSPLPVASPLFFGAGPEPSPCVISSISKSFHVHVLMTPKFVSQARMLPMCSSPKVLNDHLWNISNSMGPKGVGCLLPTPGMGPRHWLSLAFSGGHPPRHPDPVPPHKWQHYGISPPGRNHTPSSQSYSKPASSVPKLSSASVPLSVLHGHDLL